VGATTIKRDFDPTVFSPCPPRALRVRNRISVFTTQTAEAAGNQNRNCRIPDILLY
jgi:hypothetical protein